MSAPPLSATATSALQAAVILLRDTRGFMFLPLFADSERAASSGIDFLKSQLESEFYTVAWPLNRALPLSDQRLQLLGNLDDAIGKLPPHTVIVLDATGSLRHDLALEVIAYVNHRREPLRAGGLRLVLCWPAALKDELLSNAADLWSVRAASPWVDDADLIPPLSKSVADDPTTPKENSPPTAAAMAEKLERWQQYRDLKKADLSYRDALDLAFFQRSNLQWASTAELAEAVFLAAEDKTNRPLDYQTLINALNVLSNARSRLGNLTSALEASRMAVSYARQLAKTNPTAYEPDLAMSIHNLANRLSSIGDRVAALLAAQEAVDIRRRLADTNKVVFEPVLASSISNLANRLSQIGNRSGALIAAQEAVDIYRRLAKVNPDAFEPDLATCINNLAGFLSETGDRAGALLAAQEAASIYRYLLEKGQSVFEPDFAMSMSNLANALKEAGHKESALLASEEAVDIYRRLAGTNPAAYEPNFATSMCNLSGLLSGIGNYANALLAAQEAVEIYRRLVKTNPAMYEPDLAMSVNNLALALRENGNRTGALRAAEEAVVLYENVNKETPGTFDQLLAIAKRGRDSVS